MATVSEGLARHIFESAIAQYRCADLLECLWDGGSATVEPTGWLVLAYPTRRESDVTTGDAPRPGYQRTWLRFDDVECRRCHRWCGPEGSDVYLYDDEGLVCAECHVAPPGCPQ